jgi:hypothetical protein
MLSKLPAFFSRELTSPDFSRAQPDPALPWFASSKLSPPHIPLSYIHSLHSNFSSLHLDSIITVPQPLHPVLTTDKRSIFLTSHSWCSTSAITSAVPPRSTCSMPSNSYSKFEARRVENEAIKDICSGVRICWAKLRGTNNSHRKSPGHNSVGSWLGVSTECFGLMDDGASSLTRETTTSASSQGSMASTVERR